MIRNRNKLIHNASQQLTIINLYNIPKPRQYFTRNYCKINKSKPIH